MTRPEKLVFISNPSGESDHAWRRASGPFRIGDYVTRDGTDVHRIVEMEEGMDYATLECVKAPAEGWTEVGERETNMLSRYRRVEGYVLLIENEAEVAGSSPAGAQRAVNPTKGSTP